MADFDAGDTPQANVPERVGILLVNLGSPSRPSYFAVWRYLLEFLGDRRVIDAPRTLWLPVLYGFVLNVRSFRTARAYRKVWMPEGSPLLAYSAALARKLADRTTATYEEAVRVEVAMTYGEPSIASTIAKLMRSNVRRLLVVPMYPQYCSSTTGAVFDRVAQALSRLRWIPELRFVNDYYSNERYLDAVAESIRAHWAGGAPRAHLLMSFHGIPQVYVARGDPYRMQAEATARMLAERLRLEPGDWSLTYQSRFGPVLWLQPYTEDTLKRLAVNGARNVTIVSPSFAVDCLETLEEIGIQYRRTFEALGGKLTLVPALNDADAHVDALISVIKSHSGGWL